MRLNLSVESICEISVAVTAVFNAPPSLDFKLVETERIFFVSADNVGLITRTLSPFSNDEVKLTDVFVLFFIETLFVTVLSSSGDANEIFITGLKFILYKTDV